MSSGPAGLDHLIAALTTAGHPHELGGRDAACAALRAARGEAGHGRPRFAALRRSARATTVAAVLVSALAGVTGAAYTAALPAAVQHIAHHVLAPLGVPDDGAGAPMSLPSGGRLATTAPRLTAPVSRLTPAPDRARDVRRRRDPAHHGRIRGLRGRGDRRHAPAHSRGRPPRQSLPVKDDRARGGHEPPGGRAAAGSANERSGGRRTMTRAHGTTISRNQGIHAAPPLIRPTPSQAANSTELIAAQAAQAAAPRGLIAPWPR